MKFTKLTLASACLGLAFSNIGFSQEDGLKGNPSKMPAKGLAMKKDNITMKDGKMMVMKDGKVTPMEQPMKMENGTMVMMDGTLVMKDGTTMKMADDDMITMDGNLTKRDRLMLKDGKMVVVKDGKSAPMEMEMTLENGSKVMMDGTVVMKDGTTKKIADTEMILMDGKIMKIPKMPEGPKSKKP